MARTKFTGNKPSPPPEAPPQPAPSKEATAKAPAKAKITKRKGTCKFPKEVLILYEAITYGVDGKVSKNLISTCWHALTSGYIQVDHAAVARATGTNTPAARMRFTRLMKKIEASLQDAKEEVNGGEMKDKPTTTKSEDTETVDPATKEA